MKDVIIDKTGIWRQKKECHICGNSNSELTECERCEELYCESCPATYNQFSQIDYNCCESCGNRNYE